MKKNFVFTKLASAMFAVFAITAAAAAQTPSTGWYTSNPEADTFYIRTADELAGLAKIVNDSIDSFSLKTAVLMNDINLSAYGRSYNEGKGWIPIGGSPRVGGGVTGFRGNFDGNGKVVSGLYINDPEREYAGLFGGLGNDLSIYAEVRNLGIVDVEIYGFNSVGAIAGGIGCGIVASCYSTGVIHGSQNIGGLAGIGNHCNITDSYSTAYVNGNRDIGGVTGSISEDVKIRNCYSTGDVSGIENVGGVIGISSGGSVSGCYSTGAVSGAEYVGGVVGYGWALNCAALNSSVQGETAVGRVSGSRSVIYSAAFADMNGVFTKSSGNGTPILKTTINTDGTINGLFADAEIWTVANGKLPGLFGKTVDMPEHLRYTPLTWYTGKETPYIISNANEMAEFAALVNDGTDNFDGKTVILAADINLWGYGAAWNDGKGWIPIGNFSTESAQFHGTFDGDGYTISQLYINDNTLKSAGLFGYVSGGTVKNFGVTDFNIIGGNNVGALAGAVTSGGSISNCYAKSEIFIRGDEYVGGVAGLVWNASVTDGYSAANVRGTNHLGGILGNVTGGRVAHCYAVGYIYGNNDFNNLGGIVGSVHVDGGGSVINCAALNVAVSGGRGNTPVDSGLHIGRVAGYFEEGTEFSGNIAFTGIIGNFGDSDSAAAYTLVTVEEIHADSTLSGIFSDASIWTTANGRLPGLFGETVEMPTHLGGTWNISVAATDRVIPRGKPDETAVVAPVSQLTGGFTVGPNPVGKSSGAVNFFYRGKLIKSGALVVYGASGSLVRKVNIVDKAVVGNNGKRKVGSWDLTDAKGRPVAGGTYLVKGTITAADGKRERVSALVGVR